MFYTPSVKLFFYRGRGYPRPHPRGQTHPRPRYWTEPDAHPVPFELAQRLKVELRVIDRL